MYKQKITGKNNIKALKGAIILFFLYILIFAIIIITILIFSKIQLEIKNFKVLVSTENVRMEPGCKILIKIYILRKIKLLDKQIQTINFKNQNKFIKIRNKLQAQIQNAKKNKDLEQMKVLRNLKIQIKEMKLKTGIGTENAALTAILVGISYSAVSNIINFFFDLQENIDIKIEPVYQNKNLVTFCFDGIFELNLIHIINTYKVLIRKERDKKDGRTSNRRSYAYNHG